MPTTKRETERSKGSNITVLLNNPPIIENNKITWLIQSIAS